MDLLSVPLLFSVLCYLNKLDCVLVHFDMGVYSLYYAMQYINSASIILIQYNFYVLSFCNCFQKGDNCASHLRMCS